MNSGKCPLCGNMNLELVNDGLIYSKCSMCGWVSEKHKIIYGSNTYTECRCHNCWDWSDNRCLIGGEIYPPYQHVCNLFKEFDGGGG